jgi:hypothetical protein
MRSRRAIASTARTCGRNHLARKKYQSIPSRVTRFREEFKDEFNQPRGWSRAVEETILRSAAFHLPPPPPPPPPLLITADYAR